MACIAKRRVIRAGRNSLTGAAPHAPDTLYAWVGRNFGSVPQSTTFGIAVNRAQPEQIYFYTRRGQVFGTHDDGATWKEHVWPETATNVISVACASV